MQPTPPPWDSPYVVTRKYVPYVLPAACISVIQQARCQSWSLKFATSYQKNRESIENFILKLQSISRKKCYSNSHNLKRLMVKLVFSQNHRNSYMDKLLGQTFRIFNPPGKRDFGIISSYTFNTLIISCKDVKKNYAEGPCLYPIHVSSRISSNIYIYVLPNWNRICIINIPFNQITNTLLSIPVHHIQTGNSFASYLINRFKGIAKTPLVGGKMGGTNQNWINHLWT